ncbi:E3 ubiquitin-protein ligase EL5-like [Oryza brachyantha]|uniref:E3 ubiquitin-protein ligase EL5-like n=1 Tax=Oryza brachyantha TaxID=4533 RepID=UPI001ADC4484|nr:E3 ubiquitin-protein ligase EL5-like [Oryza brachyantha]
MSMAQSGSSDPAAAAVDTSTHWAPHGAVLTACVVGLNLLVVVLVFVYFWRFFSGKRGPPSTSLAGADEESSSADTSPAGSPRASWRQLPGWPAASQRNEDIASSLPVSVYSASDVDAGGHDGKAPECAVCIVEFRDGDLARLLPRCGHRFHAKCVGAWLQLHATCPLCRASVLAPATTAASESELAKNDDQPKDDAAAAAVDEECPV